MSTVDVTEPVAYRLESSKLVFAPNIVRYAIEHFAHEPEQSIAIIMTWEGLQHEHAEQLLSKQVPYTIEGEDVLFTTQ